MRNEKSTTDTFWDQRAITEADHTKVNIAELTQRTLENEFLFRHLGKNDNALEIGCGNGYLTKEIRSRCQHVDAFDYSENMVEQAIRNHGEENNKFFHGDLLHPQGEQKKYDTIICIRVLINLKNLDEQKLALKNITNWAKPGTKLILIEGYRDGFVELNELRDKLSMENFTPAPINFYSYFGELKQELTKDFHIQDTWHSGMYDLMTRIVKPLIFDEEQHNPNNFHQKISTLAGQYNPECLEKLARLRGIFGVMR